MRDERRHRGVRDRRRRTVGVGDWVLTGQNRAGEVDLRLAAWYQSRRSTSPAILAKTCAQWGW